MLRFITVHALLPVDKVRAVTDIPCPILCLQSAVNMGGEICSSRTIIQFEIGEEEPRQHSAVYSTLGARWYKIQSRYFTVAISYTKVLQPCIHSGRNS